MRHLSKDVGTKPTNLATMQSDCFTPTVHAAVRATSKAFACLFLRKIKRHWFKHSRETRQNSVKATYSWTLLTSIFIRRCLCKLYYYMPRCIVIWLPEFHNWLLDKKKYGSPKINIRVGSNKTCRWEKILQKIKTCCILIREFRVLSYT